MLINREAAPGRVESLILDLVATRSVFRTMRCLTPEGTYLAAGGAVKPFAQSLLLGPWISRPGGKIVGFLMAASRSEDLLRMVELVEAGTVRPIIDRTFPLGELPEALRVVGEGSALGKIVVTA